MPTLWWLLVRRWSPRDAGGISTALTDDETTVEQIEVELGFETGDRIEIAGTTDVSVDNHAGRERRHRRRTRPFRRGKGPRHDRRRHRVNAGTGRTGGLMAPRQGTIDQSIGI